MGEVQVFPDIDQTFSSKLIKKLYFSKKLDNMKDSNLKWFN